MKSQEKTEMELAGTEKYGRVYATVDLDALQYNMKQMKDNIPESTRLIAVVKTNAYGHGAVTLAKEFEEMKDVAGYAVATVEEAFELRDHGMKKPILILGYTFPYAYDRMICEDIRPAVFRSDELEMLSVAAAKVGKPAKIHIALDTGMSRIGILPNEEGLSFVKTALETPGTVVEGLFTHFARADEVDKTCAKQQLTSYLNFIEQIHTKLQYNIPVKHCANSASILELAPASLDMDRAGITIYGLWPSDDVSKTHVPLKPLMEIKTHISYLKELEPGVPVSYGGTYVTSRKTMVATIPVGYGDGYPRGLSNKGSVLIGGKRAPIIGRVCMDQFMVDVTDLPGIKLGDLVTLIGKDGEDCITMEELGDLSGRFNYELACCIGRRVPRLYIKNGKIVDRMI
ncbi:MAG: alanine racemase [Lachnospiraceae bacterium]|nr:alanine racemase [Lachnospiraceae bacterium]